MAKSKNLGDVYVNLDPRVRLGLQIIALGVTAYLVVRLFKGGKQFIDDKPFNTEAQETANELQVLNQNPSTKQTISNSQAMAFANKIYSCMNGKGTYEEELIGVCQAMAFANKIFSCMNGKGTYEEELIGVFNHLKNNADFLAVNKAYGTRTVLSKTYFVDDFRGTMLGAIADELDVSYIKRINAILAKKGIKRRV